jgi:hypothetical protein
MGKLGGGSRQQQQQQQARPKSVERNKADIPPPPASRVGGSDPFEKVGGSNNPFGDQVNTRGSTAESGGGDRFYKRQQQQEADRIPTAAKDQTKGGARVEKRTYLAKTTSEAIAEKREREEMYAKTSRRFMGRRTLQYALWAHRMALGSSAMCFFMGVFSVLFANATNYGCKVVDNTATGEDRDIHSNYLYNSFGTCPTVFENSSGDYEDVCCDPTDLTSDLSVNGGYTALGVVYIVYSVFILFMEDVSLNIGWGLWFPNDNWFYDNAVSPIGICHICMGIMGLSNFATSIAGICLIATGSCYLEAMRRKEAGDGGRLVVAKKAFQERQVRQAKADQDELDDELPELDCSTIMAGALCKVGWHKAKLFCSGMSSIVHFNPLSFMYRVYIEDKLAAYFWCTIFFSANIVVFAYYYDYWYSIVQASKDALVDGTLDVSCLTTACDVNRAAVRYGPFSDAVPLAKACGSCLNMNCALILLPVIKTILAKLNNLSQSFKDMQDKSDLMPKCLSYSFTRYIPVARNIDFHRMCGYTVAVLTLGHVIGHYANLVTSFKVTITYFEKWGWTGTAFLTGAIILIAMFVMFTAATDAIRHTKYEIFFNAHHCFVIFYIALFLHGPNFWAWGIFPVLLYAYDRYIASNKGQTPFMVTKVEWISPVLALYFTPLYKRDFQFKEGQYVMLNCPHIAPNEWHPFTISSTQEDMINGPRIHVETGEEVQAVPRPTNLPPQATWHKYCLLSQNWRDMNPNLFIDKSDTVYHDHVSCHIKVHGLDDPAAHTWTRKLKEHLEELNGTNQNVFPFFYKHVDHRGDTIMGRLRDDYNQPIIRVDGPHSAPSEHFTNYGTVMMVGAGIGLTPVASVVSAIIKNRWRAGVKPEILHMYWVVRANEVDSFQWLVHLLTELSFEYKKGRENGSIDAKNYCEFNIYITGVNEMKAAEIVPSPLYRAKRRLGNDECKSLFNADQLYAMLLNPTAPAKEQVERMQDESAPNRLQDVWVWNGRPNWNEIFSDMRDQRQHSEIGVCFCGAPAIGYDLRKMCNKYSSVNDDVLFTLHKENF